MVRESERSRWMGIERETLRARGRNPTTLEEIEDKSDIIYEFKTISIWHTDVFIKFHLIIMLKIYIYLNHTLHLFLFNRMTSYNESSFAIIKFEHIHVSSLVFIGSFRSTFSRYLNQLCPLKVLS